MDVGCVEDSFVITSAMFPMLWTIRRNMQVMVQSKNSAGTSPAATVMVHIDAIQGFKVTKK